MKCSTIVASKAFGKFLLSYLFFGTLSVLIFMLCIEKAVAQESFLEAQTLEVNVSGNVDFSPNYMEIIQQDELFQKKEISMRYQPLSDVWYAQVIGLTKEVDSVFVPTPCSGSGVVLSGGQCDAYMRKLERNIASLQVDVATQASQITTLNQALAELQQKYDEANEQRNAYKSFVEGMEIYMQKAPKFKK